MQLKKFIKFTRIFLTEDNVRGDNIFILHFLPHNVRSGIMG
jgi:hypothetical protein